MTNWINAGAKFDSGGRVPTKKALRDALKANPQHVLFDTTGEFPQPEYEQLASDLGNRPRHADEVWLIHGPDPYTSRKWIANVRTNRLGNLVVT